MAIYKDFVTGEMVYEGSSQPRRTITLTPGEALLVPDPDAGPDYDRGLRATIDYERSAHRKTTELLIEKDQRAQALAVELDAVRTELWVRKSEAKIAFQQMQRANDQGQRHLHDLLKIKGALELCIPIVRDLFEFTSDYKLHASCKAALAAYEELTHAATPAPAPDPVPVGNAPVRHLSDCQSERPAGVAGGQLPGPAGRQKDRAAFKRHPVKIVDACRVRLDPGNIEEMAGLGLNPRHGLDVKHYMSFPSKSPDIRESKMVKPQGQLVSLPQHGK